MAHECIYIEAVEFEPLAGGNLHFRFATGAEKLLFCMPRPVARQAIAKLKRMLDAADVAERQNVVVPFKTNV